MRRRELTLPFLLALLVVLSLLAVPAVQAQNPHPLSSLHSLITQSVDEANLVTLQGNTRPEANAGYDRGRAADDFPMEHMLLQLKRSPQQERDLQQFMEQLTDPSSPNFHHWLTAKEFGDRYGVSPQDRSAIKAWLQSHNFKVNVDYQNGVLLDFSGTAGQVREAFHTEIHQLEVNGEKHFANLSDPRIPAALAPAVVGVVSLHDFKPHTLHKPRANYTTGTGYYLVTPGDLATIYNLNPLFTSGISGQGQTVVVVEDTDVFTKADWTTFRSVFGLSSYTSGSFTQVHPAPPIGPNNCTDPGVNGDDGEAILDAEYASAAAPSAAIQLASCSNTTSFGGLIALLNLINESTTPPAVISMSYGECEAFNGATANSAFSSAYQQAAGEGVSVFVSSGDEGAVSCDANQANATHGIGVSSFTSTPYNVSVGGTDFGDSYAGTNGTYWSATNSSTYESALSYINEIPWNDSCAGVLLATFEGFTQTFGTSGFCNSSTGASFLTTGSGSGGPSGCATGSATTSGVVSGTCKGWPKPSWQSLVGNPADGVRDIPDVSLFSANGLWGHYYPFCFSDLVNQGAACTGAPDNWSGAGGTSFASPIMAAIQALVNQKTGERQGNPNPTYYKLAATEYGVSGNSSCNSTLGNATGSSCIFYDITQGDMDVNCTGTHNCYRPSGTYGVTSASNTADDLAYGTQTGWDFATGIGSVNAFNLANNWPSSAPSFTLSASPGSVSVAQGAQVTTTIAVAPVNGFTGSVTLSASGLPTGVTASFSSNPTSATSVLTLAASPTAATGAATVTIKGTSGSLTASTTVKLTVSGSATVSLMPISLSFGNQVIKTTSAAKIVTVTNTSTATLNISSITATASFAISAKTCASTLAAAAKCTVSLTFTPTALGKVTGTLTFTDNAANSPQTVALSGTGVNPAAVSPASLGFGGQAIATTSAAKVVTLTNNLATALTITSITLIGADPGDYAQTNTCGASVAAKGKCTISVTFKPTATGARAATLNISDSAANSPQTVSLTGTGQIQVVVAPASLTFVSQTVGTTSAAKVVSLTNNLSTALAITSITFTGTDPADYAQTDTCGSTVAAKTKCTISVTFTPKATGARTATLTVKDAANNSPQTVTITGTGK